MNCPHCETKNMRGSRYCKKCGKALEHTESVTIHVNGNKHAVQAFLLIIFIGGGLVELSRSNDWGVLLLITAILAAPLGRLRNTSWSFLSRVWVRILLGFLLVASAGAFALNKELWGMLLAGITLGVFIILIRFKRESYMDLGKKH